VGPAHPTGSRIASSCSGWDAKNHTEGAIFTIRPDGTGKIQVTHPRAGVLHTEPDWSSDGRWIAYTRVAPGGDLLGEDADHPNQIFRIRRDGTRRKNLSKRTCRPGVCLGDLIPAWSPNDRRIVFIRNLDTPGRGPYVFVMRADGTHARQLTDPVRRYEDFNPSWSPDGSRIVFNRCSEKLNGDAIYTIRNDGSGLRKVTPYRMACTANPDWSPDGRWIMARCAPNGVHNVWLVHPDGDDLHRLTSNPDGEFEFASSTFSPDGTMIVTSRLPGVGEAGNADLYVMNVDGSGLNDITNSHVWDSAPDWGPRPK
jgi:TolB protein